MQTAPISESAFEVRRSKAERQLNIVPNVQSEIEETIETGSGNIVQTAKRIREVAPPERQRVAAEITQKDGSIKKYYSVKIAAVEYLRVENGAWQRVDSQDFGGAIPGVTSSSIYEYVGKDKESEKEIDVFKVINLYSYGTGSNVTNGVSKTTYFIDASDRLVKKIVEADNNRTGKKRTTITFSYPRSLSIEAPVN
jgi:hypothetical protein